MTCAARVKFMLRKAVWLIGVVVTLVGCEKIPDATGSAETGPQGRIVFVGGGPSENFVIFLMRPDGSGLVSLIDVEDRADYTGPSWSPNGEQIVFASNRQDKNYDIYVMNRNGSGIRRVVDHPGGDFSPSWSPDGQRIAFQSERKIENGQDIYVIGLDGSGEQNLTPQAGNDELPAWSPDGQKIAFVRRGREVYVMNADGSNPVFLARGTEPRHASSQPAWSPDGRRIAFVSNMHQPIAGTPGSSSLWGEFEIYVMNADGSEVRRLSREANSTRAMQFPSWSPDGKWIVAERVQIDPEVSFSKIYRVVMMADDGSGVREVRTGRGARFPRWAPQ